MTDILTDGICTDIFDNDESVYRRWISYARQTDDDRELADLIRDDVSSELDRGASQTASQIIWLILECVDWASVADYVREAMDDISDEEANE